MKIDIVLTSCNNNSKYLDLYPYIYDVWKKKFNLDCYLILISDKINNELLKYKSYIILFKPIENINTAFISQNIRILYPSLFDNKNILITDMDILPISYSYFIDSVKKYDNHSFITYTDRYVKFNQYAICYNLANSTIWKEIFNINNIDDINIILKKWYNNNYTGIKNCPGWKNDQYKLFEYVQKWNNINNRLVILNDKILNFKRLDKKKKIRNYITRNFSIVKENILKSNYTDIHISSKKSYTYKNINYFEKMIQIILNQQ
jgi:hypothetical protein